MCSSSSHEAVNTRKPSCSNETGCPIFLNNWWFLPSWVITKNSVMLICCQGCVTQEGKPSTTWCDWLVLLAFFPLQTQKSPVNKADRLRTLETLFRGNTMMETRLRRTSRPRLRSFYCISQTSVPYCSEEGRHLANVEPATKTPERFY